MTSSSSGVTGASRLNTGVPCPRDRQRSRVVLTYITTAATCAFVIPYLAKSGRGSVRHGAPYLANCSMPPSLPRGISTLWSRQSIFLPLPPPLPALSLALSLFVFSARTNPRTHVARVMWRTYATPSTRGVVREIALKVPVHRGRSVSSCRSIRSVIVRKRRPLSFRKCFGELAYVPLVWIFLTPYPAWMLFFQNVFLRADDGWIIYGDACRGTCER